MATPHRARRTQRGLRSLAALAMVAITCGALAATRSSARYAVGSETFDSGGSSASSSRYALTGGAEIGATGASTAASYAAAHGYAAANVVAVAALIEGRWVFYNNSFWDGDAASAGTADDAAIASDKSALLSGGIAAFANYTSYSAGLNGIMIDIANLAGTPTLSDFTFKTGNDNDPSGWATAPSPASVTVRSGAGVHAADRVTLVWADNDGDGAVDANEAVAKSWLQVTVLATEATGLTANETFYFGNAIGECGHDASNARVTVADVLLVRENPKSFLDPATVTDPYDINRDTKVNAQDRLLVRNHKTTFFDALQLIDLSGAGLQSYVPFDRRGLTQTDTPWGVAMGFVDGAGALSFLGPPGTEYEIYASETLAGDWQWISAPLIEVAPGQFQLTHSPRQGAALFYKIVPVAVDDEDEAVGRFF